MSSAPAAAASDRHLAVSPHRSSGGRHSLSSASGQELQRKWKNLRTCFKREYDAQKNQPSGSAPKRRKYLYFEQLLFLRDSLECRNTSSSLEHTNIDLNESASEDIDVEASPKADCPPKPSSTRKSRKQSTSRSFEESLLQILQDKRDEEKDIDEDKYFLLSLLPAFRRFNDDQKFYARTEIMNIMRRVRQSGSQNQMQTPYVLDQTNSQASASQYFSTFVPRGQFQELLPPAAITSQNVWENTSTSPQF